MTVEHDEGRTNGANKNDNSLYTVSMKGGYDNQGFEGDGVNNIPIERRRKATSGSIQMHPKEKWRILKNVSAISCAFMLQFTAFQGAANLQSSINAEGGLGTLSLSTVFAALVISCIFVPSIMIKTLTVKWTLCVAMCCYIPYIAAQFYPTFYTLIPTAVILGIGGAPMWAAESTYITQAASVYAKLTDQPVDAIIVRFFGFFYFAWQMADTWGNLISSLVLSSPAHGSAIETNSTGYDHCGANFCPLTSSAEGTEVSVEIYEIMGIYIACIILAVLLIAIFVDPLTRYGEKRKGERRNSTTEELSGLQLLAATFVQLKKPYQLLLIPMTIYIGIEQAFVMADFTQSYVACAMGVQNIGFVIMCFGILNAICSPLFGSVMKYVGRATLIAFGTLVHIGTQVFLLTWKPHPDSPLLFFVASGLWGVGDAVWQTQINGLYGALFRRNKEAAFSNYRLWESVGFVAAYAYSTALCSDIKLYIQLGLLAFGIFLYVIVELHHMRKVRRQKEKERLAAERAAKNPNAIPEPETTDDEKDDIDDELVVTH